MVLGLVLLLFTLLTTVVVRPRDVLVVRLVGSAAVPLFSFVVVVILLPRNFVVVVAGTFSSLDEFNLVLYMKYEKIKKKISHQRLQNGISISKIIFVYLT